MRALAEPIPAAPPPRRRWGDLGPRLASALVLGGVALAALASGGLAWALFLALGLVGLAYEWVRLWRFTLAWAVPLALGLLAALGLATAGRTGGGLGLVVGLTLLLGAAAPWAPGGARGWVLAAGLPYFGLGGIALGWLRLREGGFGAVLFVLVVVWASDIGAYLVGRLIGGPRLAPRISPGKTWAGAAGGLVAALLAGVLSGRALPPAALEGGAWLAGGAALLLGALSQGGDLLESWLKRQAGVKDSSHLIPGHGGLLDRLDGLLAAAPAAALILWWFEEGGFPWR